MQRVSPDFSARYSTVSKTYHYQLQTGPACSPILRRFSIWKPDLDLDLFRSDHCLTQQQMLIACEPAPTGSYQSGALAMHAYPCQQQLPS